MMVLREYFLNVRNVLWFPVALHYKVQQMWRLINKLDDDLFMPLPFSCSEIVSVMVSGIPLILIKQPLFWKSAITDYIVCYEGDVGMYKICAVSFWTAVAAETTTSSLGWFTQTFSAFLLSHSSNQHQPRVLLIFSQQSAVQEKQGQRFVFFFAEENDSLENTWQSSQSGCLFKLICLTYRSTHVWVLGAFTILILNSQFFISYP